MLRVTHHVGNTGPWFGGGFYGKHRALAHNAEYVQGLGFCSFRHDDCGCRMGSLPPGPCLSGRPQTCCYLCESRQMEQAICLGIRCDVVHRIFLRLRTGSYFKLAMCHSAGNLCCRIRARRVSANGLLNEANQLIHLSKPLSECSTYQLPKSLKFSLTR